MAYLHNDKPKNDDTETVNDGTSSGLLGGYVAPTATFAPSAVQPIYGGGGSGPSVTGHVNFDRIYAANEGTAHRDATNMGLAAQNAAGAARNSLGAMQGQFSSQSKAAAGTGPTAAQREWAANASTGVTPGKKVVDAHFSSTGQTNVHDPNNPVSKAGATRINTGWKDFDNAIDGQINQSIPQADPGAVHSDRNYVTEQQEALDSGGDARPRLDANGNAVDVNGNPVPASAYTARDSSGDAANEAAVRAGAAGAYSGPESLEGMAGYQGLLGDYAKAQRSLTGLTDNAHIQGSLDEQNKGPYIEGGNKLDAALIGQAGRPDFAKLGQDYKGLGGEVGAANKASLAEAAANKATAAQNASQYQGLLGDYTGRVGADQAKDDASQAASNKRVTDAQQHAQNVGTYDAAQYKAHHGFEGARNVLHGIANGMNPIDDIVHATGNVSPTDAGTKLYGGQYAGDKADQFNAGNTSGVWGSDDADVFASMTPADWAQFNSMGPDAQKQWIAAHRKGKS